MAIPLLDTVLDLVKLPLERLIPDKSERDQLRHEIAKEALKSGMAQLEVNKAEATHASIFVAGWRPFIGWVCGLALGWHFFLFDLVRWVQLVFFPDAPVPPMLEGQDALMTILLSMLGLGGMRTAEKIKGVSRRSLKRQSETLQ